VAGAARACSISLKSADRKVTSRACPDSAVEGVEFPKNDPVRCDTSALLIS